MWALRPWWSEHVVHWVSVDAPDTRDLLREQVVQWDEEISPTQPFQVARAVAKAYGVLRREAIELVVSSGTGVAVPYFIAARLAGVPAWWVETLNVIDRPGLAARLCCHLARLVIVQHSHLLLRHTRALHVGELY